MAHAIGHRAHEGSAVASGDIGDGEHGAAATNPVSSLRDHRAVVGPDIRQGGALGDGAGEHYRVVELHQVGCAGAQANV